MRAPEDPSVLVQDDERFLLFERPKAVLEAREAGAVLPALERADAALASGRWVAGFLAYEAAAAFGLATRPPDPDGPPLLWLGVFARPREVELPPWVDGVSPCGPWQAALDEAAHASIVARLHERIAAGDSYQLNLSFPLTTRLAEEPFALFRRLTAVARAGHAAYVELGRFAIASASPELFFSRRRGRIVVRPMKGTAPRGRTREEDDRLAVALRESEKERAENLMIVDMLRNDLGRVADTGSVEVARLFSVERYPTLLQMTSTVEARCDAPLSALLAALFPCASVTGAPKRRTMSILAQHELAPRGVYTGTIGCAGPDGSARWNVAIRTAVADRRRGTLRYDVGGGIVADSLAAREYAECLLKARILEETPFALIETMAFSPGAGLRRLGAHLERLAASARHFGHPFDPHAARARLERATVPLRHASRVRLLLHADGRLKVETSPLPEPPRGPLRVGLAARPVDSRSVWLYHKTTRREAYAAAQASRPDCDEVLLWNERGEVTESAIANLVVEAAGSRLTPPVACGLLPGVERSRLIAEGGVREAALRAADLRRAARIWLVSAVRGRREAMFVG